MRKFQPVRVNAKGIQYHGFVRNREDARMAPAALRPASGGLVALPGGLA